MRKFEAHVGNIGHIGDYPSKRAAVKACRETIRKSGRANPVYYVFDEDGEIAAERMLERGGTEPFVASLPTLES